MEQELGNNGVWGPGTPVHKPNEITAAQAQVETRMTQNRRDWETMPFAEKQALRDSATKETWMPGMNQELMWDQTANSQDAYQLKQYYDDHQTPTRADLASKQAYYAYDQKRQAFNEEWRRLQGRPRKGETGYVNPDAEDGSSEDALNQIAGGEIPMLPGMDATDYALSEEAHQAAMIEEFGKSKTITENAAGRIMKIEQEQLRYPEGSPLRQELDRKKKGLEEDARHQGEGFRKFMKDRILPDFSTGPGSRIERQGGIPGYDYDESERRAQAWKELPETIQDLPRRFGEQAEKERRERYNWLMRQ